MYSNSYIKNISKISGLSFDKVKRVVNAQIDLVSINLANSNKSESPTHVIYRDDKQNLSVSINEKFEKVFNGSLDTEFVKEVINNE